MAVPAFAIASEEAVSNAAPTSIRRGEPIEAGFFIRMGEFVAPPYVLSQAGEQTFLNGEPIPSVAINVFEDEDEGDYDRPRGRRRTASPLARLERQLCENVLLIQSLDGSLISVNSYYGAQVLEILCSNLPRPAKLQTLMRVEGHEFDTAEWGAIVDRFHPTADLKERVAAVKAELASDGEEFQLDGIALFNPASKKFTYGLTVVGMLLAVFSFGTILSFRPTLRGNWKLEDNSSHALTLVKRCVVMIGLLSAFDLVCTLVAHFAGGFIEVNPMADSLLSRPVLLVVFKVAMTAVAAAILLRLKRYQGSQVASWWICLLLTLLTCRWVAVESLLLA
jgi:hypothetical protein